MEYASGTSGCPGHPVTWFFFPAGCPTFQPLSQVLRTDWLPVGAVTLYPDAVLLLPISDACGGIRMPRTRGKTKEPSATVANPYQVFVSHATADKWLARAICEKIEATGASTFRDDRDIDGGDDIPEEIRRQIKRSKELVVLLTPESVDRQWVILETGIAWGWSKKMRITVVLYHVTVDPIPDIIKQKKALHLNEFDQYTSELKKRLRK